MDYSNKKSSKNRQKYLTSMSKSDTIKNVMEKRTLNAKKGVLA
jgi:hypothetical protein